MKLSEVIKAIEDGSDNRFLLNGYTEKIQSMRTLKSIVIGELAIPLNGWEEVKPPRQWSEKELMLFKLLPGWAKWIARDRDGTPDFHELKPKSDEDGDFISEGKNENLPRYGFISEILTITFEESPIYIGDLKGE